MNKRAFFKSLRPVIAALLFLPLLPNAQELPAHTEAYRPQFHFTPHKGWMNDPNGMVYFNGSYHLFFQHNPDSTVWGPMHWGHAVSKDLVRWKELPIALYPDSLGTIFSGSAVVDSANTAGFGKNAMVAIYTNHNTALEKTGSDKFQNQSIAYSLDAGSSWTKYKDNPILLNPGIRDYRDPKVFWYQPGKKWILTLATLDHITFYASPDLKHWKEESRFGKNLGAHGGVWECPDLFPLKDNGEEVWVLIVNLNPGGPNGGSATQYFTGSFDGHHFTPDDTHIKWLDYGPDEYAGITWSGTSDRKIFLGWMSNWQYANSVPTKNWRSAMTLPRELSIKKIKDQYRITSLPVKEFEKTLQPIQQLSNVMIKNNLDLAQVAKGTFQLDLGGLPPVDFTIELSNTKGDKLEIGFDKKANRYFIDRTHAGATDFSQVFAGKHVAPRLSTSRSVNLKLAVDVASAELFADNGLTVMTSIFFPREPLRNIRIQSENALLIKQLKLSAIH
ncbi:glycoside hydrolase family 32 protein [Niabella soli]|uniref:Glycosyl hydrolase family 32 n=1 Tax=Niabella soli DSM 19437 TaxID=929713 RepID=W0F1Q8_9BACT|nr:glycoside hydrolase family 32 protein [Niabella soli]AHF16947.1 glycosyl hydrolase family 32 [Niabella soli DSM 19437]